MEETVISLDSLFELIGGLDLSQDALTLMLFFITQIHESNSVKVTAETLCSLLKKTEEQMKPILKSLLDYKLIWANGFFINPQTNEEIIDFRVSEEIYNILSTQGVRA